MSESLIERCEVCNREWGAYVPDFDMYLCADCEKHEREFIDYVEKHGTKCEVCEKNAGIHSPKFGMYVCQDCIEKIGDVE